MGPSRAITKREYILQVYLQGYIPFFVRRSKSDKDYSSRVFCAILNLKKKESRKYTKKDQEQFEKLSEMSVADTENLQEDIRDYAHEIINSTVDEKEFSKKELEIKQPIDQNSKKHCMKE